MADELVQPDMTQLPNLMGVLNESLASWEAVADVIGRKVAGDPIQAMATAVLLAGYKRVTL